MKRIVNIILMLTMCVALVLSFASCGSRKNKDTDTETEQKNMATIMLHLDGGFLSDDAETTFKVEIGEKLLPFDEPVKVGYSFKCWLVNGEELSFPYTVYDDALIVAVWEPFGGNSTETETETETNKDTDTETDTGADTNTDTEADTETDTNIESDTDESDTNAESSTQTDESSETSTESDKDTSSDTETETETESTSCGNHDYSDWLESKSPNCIGISEEARECFTCGCVETRIVETEIKGNCEFTDWAVALAPGCKDYGVSARICKYCAKVESKSISKIVHTDDDWITTTPPTCLEDGEETCNCRCEQTRVVAALGHELDVAPGTAPTQTGAGITSYWECVRCGIGGGDLVVGNLSTVDNVASSATFSHNGGDFHAFQPDKLYDGKEDNGTRSPKGGNYSIFMDYEYEQYVTSFKLKCNGAGNIPFGSTDLIFNIKNISINFYGIDGKMVHTTGTTDVSSSEYIECEVNQFITRIEIQIFNGGHSGSEYLWEVYVMAAKTYID